MDAVLRERYDVVVCGAGSSGSVIARRLAENPAVTVLLLEAGGTDDVPAVTEAGQWPSNIGSERDWAFTSEPDPRLAGRSIPFSMGKVPGGGSSINLMVWARGHRNDRNHFAAESGEPCPDPADPIRIEADALSDPEDLKAAIACVETLRDIGNSAELRPFVAREVMPGDLTSAGLDAYLRNAVTAYWHGSGTAKMGRDAMSVVDGRLKVYGVEGLRVADASIMPRITSGNTMAPCVVIGERAAEFVKGEHRI